MALFETEDRNYIQVEDVITQNRFPALLLDWRDDGTIIFELLGDKAKELGHEGKEFDTLHDRTWRRVPNAK